MTWRTHALGAVASLWLLRALPGGIGGTAASPAAPATGAEAGNLGLLALIAATAALLPDLDAKESRIKRLTIAPGIAPMYLPATALHRMLGHRGLLHSALGLFLAAVLLALPLGLKVHSWQVSLAVVLGYGSHLVLDAMTKAGIPLWFPNRRRVHLLPPRLRFTTGSMAEEVFLVLLALAAFALLFVSMPDLAVSQQR